MDIKSIVGANIRRKRVALDFSQEKLAGSSGLHRNYISDVERGRRNVSIMNLNKIAEALQVDVSKLFHDEVQ